jgi:S-DNA-T family DNA segregation ATPase FtsK/SpoIIIE
MSLDQHPEFPASWDTSKVIPGELLVPDDLSGEDIAPGIVATYEPRPPVLAKTGSAAMVVLSVTGRYTGLTARYFGIGLRAAGFLGWRYIRTHDFQEAVGGIQKKSDWNQNKAERRARWRLLGWGAGTIAGLNLAGWIALAAGTGLDAFGLSTAIPPTATGVLAATGITLYGRYRDQRPDMAPQMMIAEQDNPESDEPFPLGVCQSPGQVEDCVSRALAWEGVGTRSVRVLGYRGWGWEVDVILQGSTPGKVNAVADQLDAHFDIGQGGTLIEPDPAASAHIVLRLVQSDPFEDMPRPAVHSPNSLSVRDAVVYGRGMDGSPMEFRLRGMSMVVIGASGSAKTKGALRCLAEAITACRDAIAIEMDPVKDGLSEFADAMALPPIRGGKECTEELRHLRDIASARNKVKTAKDMGDLWEPSPEAPSIYGFCDEFIYLPAEAKALAIEILRIGRETGVHLIFAAQESTAESLGDAIAGSVTYRVMLASRSEDIRLVFGTGAAALGYRPDRLRPAVDDERVYDAGKCYVMGPGYNRPIQWRWNRFERDQIRQAVKDRKAAGRPWFDHDSLAAADLVHVIRRDGGAGEAALADRLDGLDHADAALIAVLLRTFDARSLPFLPTSEVLLPAVADAGIEGVDGGRLARVLQAHAPDVKSAREEWDGRPQVRGWHGAAVERAASGLLDPTRTRLQAA